MATIRQAALIIAGDMLSMFVQKYDVDSFELDGEEFDQKELEKEIIQISLELKAESGMPGAGGTIEVL